DGAGVEGRGFQEVEGAVGAHGEGGAELFDTLLAADGDGDDLLDALALTEAEGFFEGDLIEGVDDPGDAVFLDAAAVGEDADAGLGGGKAVEGDEDLHRRVSAVDAGPPAQRSGAVG